MKDSRIIPIYPKVRMRLPAREYGEESLFFIALAPFFELLNEAKHATMAA